jgi:phenylalanine-4-hydroxylase
VAFELERVLRTRYRIDDFQETYFVLRDLPQLLELTAIDFAPLYAHIATLSELAPGELLAKDQLLQRGHQRKARPGAEPSRAEN